MSLINGGENHAPLIYPNSDLIHLENVSASFSIPAALAQTILAAPPSSSLNGAWTALRKQTTTLVLTKSSCPLAPVVESSLETPHEDALRFPWTAKMDPFSRNLIRATSPEYMEGGTPKVTISLAMYRVLRTTRSRCSPSPSGLVHAVAIPDILTLKNIPNQCYYIHGISHLHLVWALLWLLINRGSTIL